jgi:CelD/BcsL family acetyltransferase involved in cellulose biosynthesis
MIPFAVERQRGQRRRGEWVTEPVRFGELREQWNVLAEASPFLTWEWLDAWWRSFGEHAGMRIYVSWDGAELAAGMACGLKGGHLRAMSNSETDLYRPVARSDDDLPEVLDAIAAGPWSRITMLAVPIGDSATERMVDALRGQGWLVHETVRETCPFIDTARGSFDDYVKGMSAKTRANLRRARRRLESEGRLDVRVDEPIADLEPTLAEAFELEAAGWKGRSKSATLSSERAARFWRCVSERFDQAGELRFSQLRLDGSLIAFSLDVLHGGRIYGMKISYDERLSSFAPGNVLVMEMVARAFERETQAIEMLGPMLDSKQRFATGARETMVLRAYRRRPASALRYGGRTMLVPLLHPASDGARHAFDRVRGRRHAAKPRSGVGPSRGHRRRPHTGSRRLAR